MKIAITSTGNQITDAIDERFGRAQGEIIYDLETTDYKYVENKQNVNAPQGSGIQAAQLIINEGVDAVISGHIGPKAFITLKSGGVKIYLKTGGTVEEAINDFQEGRLEESKSADVGGHW